MTRILKAFLALIITLSLSLSGCAVCLAETAATVPEHGLSLTLPDGYLLLNSETAEDNQDLIESLGYSLSSFKSYLNKTKPDQPHTLFIGVNPSTKAQVSVKVWTTDFSKRIGDLAFLNDDSLAKTAKELVTTKGASYKTVSSGGMKLIEIRSNTKDSGGDFCLVQYVTVCNNNFYSVSFSFSGSLDDGKVATAWSALESFEIKNQLKASGWDVGSVLIIIFLCLAVLGAVFVAVLTVISIVKDIKKRRADEAEFFDFIERRK